MPHSGVGLTPHGYIDNPYHSWILHRSGVLHTSPPMGLGWFYPDSRGDVYRAILRIGLRIGRETFYTAEDFENLDLASGYHSKNVISLDVPVGDVLARAVYFLAAENTLVCAVFLTNVGDDPVDVTVYAANELHRQAGADGRWEQGMTARYLPESDVVICRSFSEGIVFALRSEEPATVAFLGKSAGDVAKWVQSNPKPGPDPGWISNPRGDDICGAMAVRAPVEALGLTGDLDGLPDELKLLLDGGSGGNGNGNGHGPEPSPVLPEFADAGTVVAFTLGRGHTEDEAIANASMPTPQARTIYMTKAVEDREFWEDCPARRRLAGAVGARLAL